MLQAPGARQRGWGWERVAGQGTVTCPHGVEALHGCWLPPSSPHSCRPHIFRLILGTPSRHSHHLCSPGEHQGQKREEKSLLLLCNAPAAQPGTAKQQGRRRETSLKTKRTPRCRAKMLRCIWGCLRSAAPGQITPRLLLLCINPAAPTTPSHCVASGPSP